MNWPFVSRARYLKALGTAERALGFAESLRNSSFLRESQSDHFRDWAAGVSEIIRAELAKLVESRG